MFVGWVDANRSRGGKVDTPFMSFGEEIFKKHNKQRHPGRVQMIFEHYLFLS